MYVRSENHFLKERVVLARSGNFEYLRTLLARLDDNDVVSIFGDNSRGRQNINRPMLGRQNAFPTGPPSLARRSGCALLPVHSVWLGPQRYRVVIEPPIQVDPTLRRDEFARVAITEFAARIERAALANPASWRVWHSAPLAQESENLTIGGTSE